MALTSAQQITQLYVGYFNRAPDPEGLNYWIGRLNSGEMTINQIAQSFSEQPETLENYPFLRYPNLLENDTTAFITEIYQNAFNRDPDAEGLDYWTAQLTSGAVPVGDFIASVLSGATNSAAGQDLTTLNNKTTVGLNYADAVAQANVQWTPESAHAVLDGVNDTQASVAAADAEIAAFVAGSQQDGETVQLTIGNDVLTANVFDAPLVVSASNPNTPTLNPADVLTGVGENPTLNAALNGQAGLSPTLKGVATLNLETIATSSLNAIKATGVEVVAHEAGVESADLTVRNLGSNAAIAVNNGATGADTNIRFADIIVSGAADEANLSLTNNGTSQIASGRVNLRGETAGGFEIINVTANGVNRLVDLGSDSNAATGANITATNALRTLNVDGEGSLRIENVLQKVTKVDASENEGGVRLAIDTTVAATVLGGSGDDNIDFAGGLTNADKYDGGEGRDTIQVSSLTGLAAGNQISDVEILRINGAATGTVNLDNVSGIDTLVHNSTGAVTYNNFSASGAAENGITILNTGSVTVGLKDAATGLFDTLEVNYGNADTAVNFAAGGLTAANVEQFNLHVVASDNNSVATTTGALAVAQAAGISLDGGLAGTAFALGGGAVIGTAGVLSVINASEFLGDLTVTGNAGGQRIIGGSGNDTINTGGRGAANTPGDTLTGGAGNDDFVFAASDSTAVLVNAAATTFTTADLANFTSITDLNLGGSNNVTGVDQLNLAAVNGALVGGAITVANGGSVTALTGANFGAAVDTAVAALGATAAGLYSYGGETFLIASATAGANYTAADDIVIRVTGVTGTLDASDFV